jgi:hypothetical protein
MIFFAPAKLALPRVALHVAGSAGATSMWLSVNPIATLASLAGMHVAEPDARPLLKSPALAEFMELAIADKIAKAIKPRRN